MKKLTFLAGVAAIAGAVVLGNAANAAEKITPQQYMDLVVGNTVFGKTSKGKRWMAFSKSDGRIIFKMESGYSDEGIWEIKDGKQCQRWKKIRKGKYYCQRDFELDGDMVTMFNEAEGKRIGPFRIHTGNASAYEDVN